MKKLPLPSGHTVLLDSDDYDRCAQLRWYLSDQGYVVRAIRKGDGTRKIQKLSRFIMSATDGTCVDHIDGNLLDNRRSNLRLCTQQQNTCNRTKGRNNTSGFKGVSWNKKNSKWLAQIMVNYTNIYLGLFTDINEAASAYAAAAKKHHGEFART